MRCCFISKHILLFLGAIEIGKKLLFMLNNKIKQYLFEFNFFAVCLLMLSLSLYPIQYYNMLFSSQATVKSFSSFPQLSPSVSSRKKNEMNSTQPERGEGKRIPRALTINAYSAFHLCCFNILFNR
jgi:hypothetical protein